MPTVLVDTAAWIALVNTRDELHNRAEQTMADLRRRNVALVTTEFVLLEVANALCTSAWRGKGIRLIDGLRSLSTLRIIPVDATLLAEGWGLYRTRLDKEWSLTDCTSMVVMQRERIEQVFTFRSSFRASRLCQVIVICGVRLCIRTKPTTKIKIAPFRLGLSDEFLECRIVTEPPGFLSPHVGCRHRTILDIDSDYLSAGKPVDERRSGLSNRLVSRPSFPNAVLNTEH
jgi:predicted nucleic acid-binding protein